MILNLNIYDITQPVIKEANKSSFVKRFLAKSLESFLLKRVSKLNSTLDNSILKVEGTHVHLKELSTESANNMLIQIKESIVNLEKLYDEMQECNYFDSNELKSKFKYLLKSLYKSEAITHKIAYREKETLKTDESIKNGIIKMNSHFYKKSV
ncbi:hypothetical protein [Yeosuana sp.]|uniref:hypothetical protein n=1 Tax=Yeosuana sp. TaxID=2529388 RepID=UPI004054F8CD|tara:strand:+ start:521 stop:979 length:459 start_codon:yes stop_codon:yes gene_type:complete